MTNKDLIDRLAESLDVTKTDVQNVLKGVVSEFTNHLEDGVGFSIPDLGTFKTRIKEVQKIYNPHYKKYMLVPPKRVVEFSPGKTLKEAVKFTENDHE
ncbi:MAG: HU family DNA-binding protein [Balneolaceae bacterium]